MKMVGHLEELRLELSSGGCRFSRADRRRLRAELSPTAPSVVIPFRARPRPMRLKLAA
jgi:hypothetical protein